MDPGSRPGPYLADSAPIRIRGSTAHPPIRHTRLADDIERLVDNPGSGTGTSKSGWRYYRPTFAVRLLRAADTGRSPDCGGPSGGGSAKVCLQWECRGRARGFGNRYPSPHSCSSVRGIWRKGGKAGGGGPLWSWQHFHPHLHTRMRSRRARRGGCARGASKIQNPEPRTLTRIFYIRYAICDMRYAIREI